ncbi:fasciclin-like arabinogalactan protein 1 [Zingiber officinale]|uniref:FAS1 domain-containing protein n=1 Tax=Zingiber officinale TaxID=94328 RepID=A0A8J5FKG8_ZINOF|nr:fasciclin-like arabinogalactan protein 1 [Zingiber officinale]KAG6490195.1 hypothetical protein ZIOFF_051480 [Zingiber officinale]
MRVRQQRFPFITLLLLCFPLFQAAAASTVRSSHASLDKIHNRVLAARSAAAKAPAAPAAPDAPVNLTSLMARKGCAAFANLLASTSDAAQTFASSVDGGLTAFCPIDQVMKPFLPTFKNLTPDGKLSLILYHALPVYYSIASLRTGNGVVNTLATDGAAKNYNLTVQNEGEQVTLKTRLTVATITATLIDKDPLAIYAVDEVLRPEELFKPAESTAPTPAPAQAPAPEAPKKKKKAPKAGKSEKALAPAGPQEQPGDQKAADESAAARNGLSMVMAMPVATAALAMAVSLF